ncbi:NAD-dependent epimerase/dehydratase family protein [Paenibacillus doosanensis]|uniref:2'-dehydrokanamycin reductase n=1 Tax=Paenibacillus konkukensis TaxID=2020716 RepID=A0ABY4RL78_9BACL|nr:MULTISPECIES: NAD-dependent epimerase/dehydratase family protein [Paenibacillus]MCS7462358.1 NAD-dependent epimerase/dehydratase family protein [Paenibacillus doosanensis]UQZ83262.1 2'-dehydrokanamycin reductase [Paenibacillus konkukensis]
MKVLVLGGTGVISRSIVEAALAKQYEVAVFNRGSKNHLFSGEVECITGDKSNREQFRELMKDRRFDAVIDMISFDAADAQATLEALHGRAGQFVFCSSTAAYKRPFRTIPTAEDAEELFDDPSFAYAFQKAEMERYLGGMIKLGEVPVTIIRPSLTYGIGCANLGVLRQNFNIVHRIRSRKPLLMFGDGTVPWSFSFAPDVAKAFVGAVGNSNMYGKSYHATNEDVHIWQDLYLEFGKLLGVEPNIVHISTDLLVQASPALFSHLYYEKSYSGLFDNSKLKRDLPGYQADISLSAGLSMLLDWYERDGHQVDTEKDLLEDRLTGLYTEFGKQLKLLSI